MRPNSFVSISVFILTLRIEALIFFLSPYSCRVPRNGREYFASSLFSVASQMEIKSLRCNGDIHAVYPFEAARKAPSDN